MRTFTVIRKYKLRLLVVIPNFFISRLIAHLSNLFFIVKFIASTAGKDYGITHMQKFKLTLKIRRNNKKIKSLTTYQQHMILAEEVFKVPKLLKGDVVECGAFNGATTASLSLVCALTGRRLITCDSFEGLPVPKEDEKYAIVSKINEYYLWQTGEYASEGGIAEVKKNVTQFGNLESCKFVKGYFNDTLKELDTDSIVLIFEDADLPSSVADCLRYLWPKLQEGCKFFCHEPWSVAVVSLFYDKNWWKTNLNTEPPGFWGSGLGMATGLSYTGMGYSKKLNVQEILEHGKKRTLPGSKS